jgi:peroxiredoxin
LRSAMATIESQTYLQLGATVPEIVGLDSTGSVATLHYGDVSVPTVLYVFTPQCGWCKKNLPNFHALIDQSGTRYRVVGIALSREDLNSYIERENLQLPIYSEIRSDIRQVYQFGGTPETIVVSPDRKIIKIWSGAYEDRLKSEIEKVLKIHLPGCCQLASM